MNKHRYQCGFCEEKFRSKYLGWIHVKANHAAEILIDISGDDMNG